MADRDYEAWFANLGALEACLLVILRRENLARADDPDYLRDFAEDAQFFIDHLPSGTDRRMRIAELARLASTI